MLDIRDRPGHHSQASATRPCQNGALQVFELITAMGNTHVVKLHPTYWPNCQLVSIVSDRSFPRHTHDEFGIGYICKGSQRSWSGRGEVRAGAGNVITVNPGELHDGIVRRGRSRAWHMLYLAPEIPDTYLPDDGLQREITSPVVDDPATRQRVRRCLTSLADQEAERLEQEESLVRLLACVFTVPEPQRSIPGSDPSPPIRRVLDTIHADPSASPSLSSLATLAGLDRYQLIRRFAREVGTTPYRYILQRRVADAKRLIRKRYTLADIAMRCGFADQSHMTRAFTRQFGYSPGQYRKQYQVE